MGPKYTFFRKYFEIGDEEITVTKFTIPFASGSSIGRCFRASVTIVVASFAMVSIGSCVVGVTGVSQSVGRSSAQLFL